MKMSFNRVMSFAILVFVLFSSRTLMAAYCSASGGGDEYIYQVQVGTINNNVTGSNSYTDYTANQSTIMQPGTTYTIIIVTAINGEPYFGYPGDQLGIWIDWNSDQTFGAGETVYTVSDYGYFQTPITPPAGTLPGNKRMRIRLTFEGSLSSCGATQYGEVEDYQIVIPNTNNGKISGNAFNDMDGDGNWDTGESVTAGWEIFIDIDNDGSCDAGDMKTTTDMNGSYEFSGLASGTYRVAEVRQSGWYQTFPDDVRHLVSLSAGQTVTNKNFGNRQFSETFLTIGVSADAYVNQSNPTRNYGTTSSFSTGKNSVSLTRGFLKFDLSAIPAGEVITKAKLILTPVYVPVPSSQQAVYRVGDNWEETTLNWDNQPSKITSPGPLHLPNSQIVVEKTIWDVTENVDDDYVSGAACSLMIQGIDESKTGDAWYISKDSDLAAFAAILLIEHEPLAGGGTGKADDPYQIWTGQQMNKIGAHVNRWSKSYKLMDDISLSAYSGSAYNIIGNSAYAGSSGDGPFAGVFDGNNHSISGFSYSAPNKDYVGLFGCIGQNAIVKNLKVISPNLTGDYYVGPIAGYTDKANILGCSVIGGTVQGNEYVGGLIGFAGCYIASCSSSATVSGNNLIGGLAGVNYPPYCGIIDSYAQGKVSGNSSVGGLTGESSDTMVINCYSTGLVSGTSNVGGLTGYNFNHFIISDNVINCFWDTTTSGMSQSAAGKGLDTAAMQNINTYLDAGWDFIDEVDNGGGDNWAIPAGGGYPVLWHQLWPFPALPNFAGGFGTTEDPYLIETEAQLNSISGNARLMDKNFKLTRDLDFTNLKYRMIAEQPYIFTGTFDGANHSISDMQIKPLFKTTSAGIVANLKGSQATVKNLTLTDPNVYAELGYKVGSIVGHSYGAVVTNCHALNARVFGMSAVGGIAGSNYQYATMSNCSATGYVSENTYLGGALSSPVGGLVGENSYWSEIDSSFAICNISGIDFLGGLAGSNFAYSTISNCYARGSVTGTSSYIGGLVGRSLGGNHTKHCYSTVFVSGPKNNNTIGSIIGGKGTGVDYYSDCFWDSQINNTLPGIGNATDPNVIGQTTANMQTRNTFESMGWDFENTWKICEGTNYPKLKWQIPLPGDFVCPDGVDYLDNTVFAAAWMSQKDQLNWNAGCDISEPKDNIIDWKDLAVLAENWLKGIE